MYCPSKFVASDAKACIALIQDYPLATLAALIDGQLCLNYVPMEVVQVDTGWVLKGHISKQNELWLSKDKLSQVTILFTGVSHYISPNWYATKAEHHKVVPTYNYCGVEVKGKFCFIEDHTELIEHLNSFTLNNEHTVGQNWQLRDAPKDYIHALTQAIVGIHINISSLIGKFKLSQNQPIQNKQSVITALNTLNTNQADSMADAIKLINRL